MTEKPKPKPSTMYVTEPCSGSPSRFFWRLAFSFFLVGSENESKESKGAVRFRQLAAELLATGGVLSSEEREQLIEPLLAQLCELQGAPLEPTDPGYWYLYHVPLLALVVYADGTTSATDWYVTKPGVSDPGQVPTRLPTQLQRYKQHQYPITLPAGVTKEMAEADFIGALRRDKSAGAIALVHPFDRSQEKKVGARFGFPLRGGYTSKSWHTWLFGARSGCNVGPTEWFLCQKSVFEQLQAEFRAGALPARSGQFLRRLEQAAALNRQTPGAKRPVGVVLSRKPHDAKSRTVLFA